MTRPACLTNKRLPKEAKDYEIRSRSREKGKAARLSLPEVVERSVAHCGTQVLRTRFSFVFRGVRVIIGRGARPLLVSSFLKSQPHILLRDTLWFFLFRPWQGQEIRAVSSLCGLCVVFRGGNENFFSFFFNRERKGYFNLLLEL